MNGEKILIVDDEVDVLELCRRILETKGYEVKTAPNGYEAIEMSQSEHFDLLLTDIKMPGITGLEIAKNLKQANQNIICITMTGFGTIDMVLDALKLDVDEFVMKPFTPNELVLAISKALEKQRLRRENFRLNSLIPLFELNKSLLGTRDVNKLLPRLIEIAKQETKADVIWLYTFEGENITHHAHPDSENTVNGIQSEVSYQLAQRLLTNSEQLTIERSNCTSEETVLLDKLQAEMVVASPLRSQKSNLGALVLSRQNDSFAPSDREFLSVMCGQAGIALENARLFTEKEEAYEALKKLDFMKSEFINIAAHELRTPLTILMGYTTILEDVADEPQREFISPIMRNAMRLRSLIDDMLNLQYLESGIPNIGRVELRLQEAVQNVISDIGLLVEKENLTVNINIPDDFPVMIADMQKFDLIMVNLLNNAVKFNKHGGSIIVSATHDGNYASISVADTGIGVPAKEHEKIFDKFYQVENSLTREYGGIGLGLAIVRGMAEVCGGKVWAESREGEGATFTFTMPLDNTNLKESKLKI
ncbi:response regulator [Anaerolineales bacterium HSG25]|nr:response regulator [Anaerolineales bacterium HSG25]